MRSHPPCRRDHRAGVARGYGTWEAFHDAALAAARGDEETRAEMDALDQIGDTVIDALAAYFKEKHNLGIVERLTKEVKILEAEKPASNTVVAGKTVVFTGSLEKMTPMRPKPWPNGSAPRPLARIEEDRLCVAGPGPVPSSTRHARPGHGADRG